MKRPSVNVLSYGLSTGLACGAENTWARMRAGCSSVSAIKRFPVDHLPVQIASLIEISDAPCTASRTLHLAKQVASEAIVQLPGIEPWLADARLVLATAKPQREWPMTIRALLNRDHKAVFEMARTEAVSLFGVELSKHLGTSGIWDNIDTACASGATAIQVASELITDQILDLAVVVGAEASVFEEQIVRFSLLSALSTRNSVPAKASRPFCVDRDGFVMGEGAACVILSSDRVVEGLGVQPLARITGWGDATDNFHLTRSSPDARAPIAAMSRALQMAGMHTSELHHINAHGTSTPENDKIEGLAIRTLFKEDTRNIPVTANKSQIGHTLSACGAVEGVLSIMSIVKGEMLGTLNYDNPDPSLQINVTRETVLRSGLKSVLCNSFGFGGQNVSILYQAPAL